MTISLNGLFSCAFSKTIKIINLFLQEVLDLAAQEEVVAIPVRKWFNS